MTTEKWVYDVDTRLFSSSSSAYPTSSSEKDRFWACGRSTPPCSTFWFDTRSSAPENLRLAIHGYIAPSSAPSTLTVRPTATSWRAARSCTIPRRRRRNISKTFWKQSRIFLTRHGWTLASDMYMCLNFSSNGKESTVNRALGGSTYPG